MSPSRPGAEPGMELRSADSQASAPNTRPLLPDAGVGFLGSAGALFPNVK